MFELSPDRKRYLLQQNQQFRPASSAMVTPTKSSGKNTRQPSYAASYGPSSAAALLPRLVPQLTGDAGLIRRFSMSGLGAGNVTSPVLSANSSDYYNGELDPVGGTDQVENVVEDIQPLQPQSTGGWSSWWISSGGEKVNSSSKETVNSVKWYVDGIRNNNTGSTKLVKHLISLRVHLSTAKLIWIEGFVGEEKGLNALSELLAHLVGKGGKKKDLSDVQTTVLLEVVKCLRVLLNTEVGHDDLRCLAINLLISSCSARIQSSLVFPECDHSYCVCASFVLV
jgi:diaphanous 1